MPGLYLINSLPAPPSQNRPESFGTEAEQFLGSLPQFSEDLNQWATAINQMSSDLMGGTVATSTTSLSVGAGTKSLTIQAGKNLAVGNFLRLFRTSAMTTQQMLGFVSAYNGATGALTVEVSDYLGSGTYNDWTVVRTFEEVTTGTAPDQVPRNWMLGSAAWQNVRFIDYSYVVPSNIAIDTGYFGVPTGFNLPAPGIVPGDYAMVWSPLIAVFPLCVTDVVYVYYANLFGNPVTIEAGTVVNVRVMKRVA